MPIKSVSIFFIHSPISTISILTLFLDTEYLECLNHLNHPQGSCAHKHTKSCAHLHTDTCAHRHTRADTRTHRQVPGLTPGAVSFAFILPRGRTQLPSYSFSAPPPTHSPLGLSDVPPTLIPGRFPFFPSGPFLCMTQSWNLSATPAVSPKGGCLENWTRPQCCCHSRPPSRQHQEHRNRIYL